MADHPGVGVDALAPHDEAEALGAQFDIEAGIGADHDVGDTPCQQTLSDEPGRLGRRDVPAHHERTLALEARPTRPGRGAGGDGGGASWGGGCGSGG
jgi:hypothetical protein